MIREGQVKNDIFIPKYYDPELEGDLAMLASTHHLPSIGALLGSGEIAMRQGNYIGKMHYGTGLIPYIRTSDLANYELRGSPKHGISDPVAAVFRQKQSIEPDDVLLVHEGTYLIGTACLITRYDTQILYQHHVARLRVNSGPYGLSGPLLMSGLISKIVQRQIRNRQFTADVIDSIVGRLLEVRLPIPKDEQRRATLDREAREVFEARAEARLRLAVLSRQLDEALVQGDLPTLMRAVQEAPDQVEAQGLVNFLGGSYPAESFVVREGDIQGDVMLPRYYDPTAESRLRGFAAHNDLVSIGQLVNDGVLELQTGDEVGKLAYGTGNIPFVRTSDLANWELKQDPKQRVSEAVYAQYAKKQGVLPYDILLVRDGTYLVGSSGMVMPADVPLLISGGLYRLRVLKPEVLDPFLLLALINTQIAGRQMRNKRFTRDVIDTLGRRLEEVVLPIPKDDLASKAVAETMRELVTQRADLRVRAAQLGEELSLPGAAAEPL